MHLIGRDVESLTESRVRRFLGLGSRDICYKPFDCKVRTPRVLLCGHTFCQFCLENILSGSNNGVCPSCRKNIATTSVAQIAVNQLILSFVSNIEKKNTEQKSSTTEDVDELNLKKAIAFIKAIDKMMPVGHCPRHWSPVNFKCFDCSVYFCGPCDFLLHMVCNRVLPIAKAIDVIKDKGVKKLLAVKKKDFKIFGFEINETLRRYFKIRPMTSIQDVERAMEELDLYVSINYVLE